MTAVVRPKILGQVAPTATTSTTLYSVPSRTETQVDGLICANRGASADAIRVSVSKYGAAISDADYIHYDVPLPANDTLSMSGSFQLEELDIVRVRSSLGTTSFSLFGIETFPVNTRFAT